MKKVEEGGEAGGGSVAAGYHNIAIRKKKMEKIHTHARMVRSHALTHARTSMMTRHDWTGHDTNPQDLFCVCLSVLYCMFLFRALSHAYI